MLGPGFGIWDIAAYRFWGGVVALLLIFGRRENFFRPRNPGLMLIRGVVGSATFVLLVIAIRNIPYSAAMVFFYSFPAFAAFFSAVFFGEKASRGDLLCISVTIAGIAVLFDFKFGGGIFGQAMGALAGVMAGLTTCLIKKLRETNGSAIIYFYLCLVGGLVTAPFFLMGPRFPQTSYEWLLVGGIVATSTSAQLLMTRGFKYCKSWEGGVFMSTEVIFALVIGIAFFSEQMTWRFFIGGAMIVLSAFAFQVKIGR
jgi:drug/metabolite transporter (DMT)-like permease